MINADTSEQTRYIPVELKLVVLSILESFINTFTRVNPLPQAQTESLDGKVITIEITDLNFKISLIFSQDSIEITENFTGEANTTVRMDIHTLFELVKHRGSTPSNIKMEILGEIETGQTFKNMLDAYEIDWEEQLSKITGDLIANRVGQFTRQMQNLIKTNFSNFSQTTADYIIEEKQLVPHPVEIKEFINNVDLARNHLDRLQARANRLLSKSLTL